jgi:hypothetical protein
MVAQLDVIRENVEQAAREHDGGTNGTTLRDLGEAFHDIETARANIVELHTLLEEFTVPFRSR